MARNVSTNTYGVAKFVVSPDPTQGTHTTIQAAINDAVAGDTVFVRDGTYVESLSLKDDINLVSLNTYSSIATIQGTITYTGAASGVVNLTGFLLDNSTATNIIFSGSGSKGFNITQCQIKQNGSFPLFTASNTNVIQVLNIRNCTLTLQAAGASLFNITSGSVNLDYCVSAGGLSTTQAVCSGGFLKVRYCDLFSPILVSGTGNFQGIYSTINTSTANVIPFTSTSTGTSITLRDVSLITNSVSCLSIGTGATVIATKVTFSSTAADTVVGLGTFYYVDCDTNAAQTLKLSSTTLVGQPSVTGSISFDGNVNKLSNYTQGTFTPTIGGATTAGTANYASQAGTYTRIGNRVFFSMSINWNTATGTGQLQIKDLPFTAAGLNHSVSITVMTAALGAGNTSSYLVILSGGTLGNVTTYNAATGVAAPFPVPAAAVLQMEGFYQV